MNEATLVYPHQLFHQHPAIKAGREVYLIEDPLFFSQYRFHRQKLMLHRASMKRYESELKIRKRITHYVDRAQVRISSDIASILSKAGIKKVHWVDPEDNYLQRRVPNALAAHGIQIDTVTNPNFLTPIEVVHEFVDQKKKLFFTQFYIQQRTRLNCLIDAHGKPIGGKWSFDTENRRKLPKTVQVPRVSIPKPDRFSKDARAYVEKEFPDALGEPADLLYPSSADAAQQWLKEFIQDRIASFGDYEDAIVGSESFLFHSVLTPMLNIGLITPQEVLDAVLAHADSIELNSLEGFVRQIIGWREFIRLVYREKGSFQRTTNFWKHKRTIPSSFYQGTTGLEPIDVVLKRLLKTGYCHHIERLMILGNFMMLCEFDPDEIYRWFMEMFVDAYDWVMVPNVYGMSQHADGGLMTTKPYLSGSSYVLRMSDFKRGDWCEVWDGLYWRFMAKHRSFFEKNPRMSVMTKQLDRMGSKLQQHQKNAEKFLKQL